MASSPVRSAQTVAESPHAAGKGKLALRDARSGEVLWESLFGGEGIWQVRFGRDSQRLFVCSSEERARASFPLSSPENQLAEVLDAATGSPVFPRIAGNLTWSVFSPHDRWLAVGLTNHVIQLLDTRNGQLVVELKGHSKEITTLAFSDNGSLLASGGRDGSARIWRLPSGEPVGKPFADDQPMKRVALSADGRFLATATDVSEDSQNTRVQVWDVQAGGSSELQ